MNRAMGVVGNSYPFLFLYSFEFLNRYIIEYLLFRIIIMGSIKLSNIPAISGQISFNVPLPIISFTNTFSESQINAVGNSFQFKISEIDSANNQTVIGTRTVGNSARPFITRYDAQLNQSWFKNILFTSAVTTFTSAQRVTGITRLNNVNYVVGSIDVSGTSESFGYMAAISDSGNLLAGYRTELAGVNTRFRFGAISQFSNGDLLIVGHMHRSIAAPSRPALLMRVDILGNIVWSRSYGSSIEIPFDKVAVNSDDSFYCVQGGGTYLDISRFNSSGVLLNKNVFNLSELVSDLVSVKSYNNDLYVALGLGSTPTRPSGLVLVKFNTSLNATVWVRRLNTGINQAAKYTDMTIIPGEGIISTGYIQTTNNPRSMIITKYDFDGNLLLSKMFIPTGSENLPSQTIAANDINNVFFVNRTAQNPGPFVITFGKVNLDTLPDGQPFGLFSVSAPGSLISSEPLLLTPNNLTSTSSAIPVSFVPAVGIQLF